jgi:DivIVA domain-containing protein
MALDRTGRIGPEAIARTTFQTSFRGYDQEHVRAFLDEIAEEMREQRDREAALRKQIEGLEARVTGDNHLDEEMLTAALGEETARVLTAARSAAGDIRAKAEEGASRVLKEAHDQATQLRDEAASVLAQRTEEAEQEAAKIRGVAEEQALAIAEAAEAAAAEAAANAEQLVRDAQADAIRVGVEAAAAAEAEIEAALATGRQMVHEAQAVRERVLKDLARKRKSARVQLEQLRAGRERLMEAYAVVRRTLDEVTEELRVALTEAKLSADSAARRAESEPEAELEELEAEVVAAQMAGLGEPVVAFEPIVEAAAPPVVPERVEEAVAPVVEEDSLPPLPDEIPPAPETPRPIVPPRGKGKRRGVPDLPPVELTPLTPRDPVEGMRVITGETPVVVVSAPVTDAPVEDEEPPAETDEASVDVDDLFARIRAARAAEVAKAEAVLADADAHADADSDSDAVIVTVEDVVVETDEGVAEVVVIEVEAVEAVEVEAVEDEKSTESTPTDADETVLERRDGVLEPIEQRITRKLKRVLADEQNDALDKLRRTHATTLDALFPPLDEQLAMYATPVRDELAAAAYSGASFNGEEREGPAIDDVGLELASALVAPMRERITNALRDAAGDEDAGADGIRACYREWKSQRIGALASDAALAAFNRGVFDAVSEGSQLRWVVDHGGTPCPDAEDNALAGLVPRGEAFPTGHCYPPAHPGCRCLIVAEPAAE